MSETEKSPRRFLPRALVADAIGRIACTKDTAAEPMCVVLQLFAPLGLLASWRAVPGEISPPRSGPAAATDEAGDTWLFGGYAEEQCEVAAEEVGDTLLFGGYAEEQCKPREVVNDLLRFSAASGRWERQQETANADDARPGGRLASACAVSGAELLLFGGWDPQTAGTGGAILDDVWAFDLAQQTWSRCTAPMPAGPSSRHVAVNVGGTVIVHTFRCIDSVLVWDHASRSLVEQLTTGEAPSSRGLHAAAAANDHTLVVFGGAAKDGVMANDAFALDTTKWEWRRLAQVAGPRPSAPAGACAATLPGRNGIVLCCGAEASAEGLVPRADAWSLTLDACGDAVWCKLLDDDAPGAPGPRNAATLTPLGDGEGLLLHGGWFPFRATYGDSHVLWLKP